MLRNAEDRQSLPLRGVWIEIEMLRLNAELAEPQCGHLRTFLLRNVKVQPATTENYRSDANKC